MSLSQYDEKKKDILVSSFSRIVQNAFLSFTNAHRAFCIFGNWSSKHKSSRKCLPAQIHPKDSEF